MNKTVADRDGSETILKFKVILMICDTAKPARAVTVWLKNRIWKMPERISRDEFNPLMLLIYDSNYMRLPDEFLMNKNDEVWKISDYIVYFYAIGEYSSRIIPLFESYVFN